jgi:hypothetical protein
MPGHPVDLDLQFDDRTPCRDRHSRRTERRDHAVFAHHVAYDVSTDNGGQPSNEADCSSLTLNVKLDRPPDNAVTT